MYKATIDLIDIYT